MQTWVTQELYVYVYLYLYMYSVRVHEYGVHYRTVTNGSIFLFFIFFNFFVKRHDGM